MLTCASSLKVTLSRPLLLEMGRWGDRTARPFSQDLFSASTDGEPAENSPDPLKLESLGCMVETLFAKESMLFSAAALDRCSIVIRSFCCFRIRSDDSKDIFNASFS